MAKINFYLFEKSAERQVESACRLCRKLLGRNERIWFLCTDTALQQALDDLLWNFDSTSFIAHGIDQIHAPVCISNQLPEDKTRIIFNFTAEALENFQIYNHIIEIIENNEQAKQLGRQKFKQYRSLGIEPTTYKL